MSKRRAPEEGMFKENSVSVLFFAQFRERLKTERLEWSLETGASTTVAQLRDALVERGREWRACLCESRCLVALNQEMVDFDTRLQAGDEVAFFPPVTGG